jgi:hypothetical protein
MRIHRAAIDKKEAGQSPDAYWSRRADEVVE